MGSGIVGTVRGKWKGVEGKGKRKRRKRNDDSSIDKNPSSEQYRLDDLTDVRLSFF